MNVINGIKFKEMLESGAANLSNNFQKIDALNVFPVPDGDTGTNMSLTFTSGVNDALKIEGDKINEVAKKLSKGLLMGARGNSGVILSQIFRGFYQGLENIEEANAANLANAFENGTKIAYKAVMRPVEGTILTVIREASWYAKKYTDLHPEITIDEYLDKLVAEAKASLDHTPELLPVLKEVGVVDSGGAGLLLILEGFKAAIDGNPIVKSKESESVTVENNLQTGENQEFGYCTEFLIKLEDSKIAKFEENKLKTQLEKIGNSIVVVQDEEIVKVHVHTLTPGDALNLGQRYGEFLKLKIENMQEQHEHIANSPEVVSEPKEYGLITVAAGDGLVNLFKEYRADIVISGGQTMNPSTEDFVDAIKSLNAKNIFILPNNSNIVLAAKQAKDIMEDLNITVIESKTLAQGLSACIMFNPEDTLENNINEMTDAITRVKTGQITYAIKDTTFDGLEIKNGDYMAILEKSIVVANNDKQTVLKGLLDQIIADEDLELLTIVKGEDGTEEDLNFITNYVEENSSLEIEVFEGNQPVYSFIFGAE